MTDAYSWKWIFLTFFVAAFNLFNGVCPAETLHISTSSFDPSAQFTALNHVTLVPMTEEKVVDDQTVLVKGKTIVDIGPSTQVPMF